MTSTRKNKAIPKSESKRDGVAAGWMTLEASSPSVEPPKAPSAEGIPKAKRLSIGSMVETNGASSLEQVEGFDTYVARNRGLFQPSAAPLAKPPAGSGFSPQNVQGSDNRVPVGDTTRLPWRSIAMLTITYQNGLRALGTAWFLGPKSLGTAGHNILHPEYGQAREILITPAYDGVVAPFGTYFAKQTYCDPRWLNGNFDATLDFGILLLNDPTVGERLGWFGFASYPNSGLSRLLVNVAGYVVDRSPCTQYFNGGRLEGAVPQFLLYDFDTERGMSGSPIFALFGNKRVVVGIHTYGSNVGNRARRIDDGLFDVLTRFV